MAIEFEFYQVPRTSGSEEKRYYAKVMNHRTVTTAELAEEIQADSTLTTADIQATILALSGKLAQHLKYSERVHIEGLGYFEATLQCAEIRNPKDTRAGKVRFKSVNFRADKKLKEKMRTAKTERTHRKTHSAPCTPEQVDAKLTEFFGANAFLMRRDLERICKFTTITANRHLKRLIEEKKLRNASSRYHPVYVPAEGWYGKGKE